MIQTFTPVTDFTTNPAEQEKISALPEFAEPSAQTIQNILSYSKNLEVKPSEFVNHVEFIKS